MDQVKLPLISNKTEEFESIKEKTRLGITVFLCTIPLLDAFFVLFCITRKRVGNIFNIVHSFGFFYILIAIATTLVGYYGIYFRHNLALRSSIILFTAQNVLILLISSNLFYLFLRYKEFFKEHHAPKFLIYFEKHRGLGVFLFVLNFCVRLLNSVLTWYCGELEATFENFARSKFIKDKHRKLSDNDKFQIHIKDDFEEIY